MTATPMPTHGRRNGETPKVKTLLAAGRATAPFIVDQHLVFGAGNSIQVFGDAERLQQRRRPRRRAHPVVAGSAVRRARAAVRRAAAPRTGRTGARASGAAAICARRPSAAPARRRGAMGVDRGGRRNRVAALAIALPPARPVAAVPTPGAAVASGRSRPRSPRAPSAPPVEVVLTPVTHEDFARAGETAYAQGQHEDRAERVRGGRGGLPGRRRTRATTWDSCWCASAGRPRRCRICRPQPRPTRRSGLSGSTSRGRAGSAEIGRARWPTTGRPAQLFPDDHATLYNLGRALQKLGDHGEAVAALERAVALQPGEPSLLLTLASSYEKLSRVPDAVQAYRQFLDRDPQARDASAIRQRITRLEQVGAPDGQVVPTSATVTGERAQARGLRFRSEA